MEIKTKEGKYFSQLGSWGDLFRIIFLLILFKIFGILGAILGGIFVYFLLPKILKSQSITTNKNTTD